MKLLLSLVLVGAFAVLAGAQVAAPNPQGSDTLAQSVEKAPDGSVRLRGNVVMAIQGTIELHADEIDVSPDGRTMTLRQNVTVRIPAPGERPSLRQR
jgi:lipopolysaccharide export system protein LptA